MPATRAKKANQSQSAHYWSIENDKGVIAKGKLDERTGQAAKIFYRSLLRAADAELEEKRDVRISITSEKSKGFAQKTADRLKEELGMESDASLPLASRIKKYFSDKRASLDSLAPINPRSASFGLKIGQPPTLAQKILAGLGGAASIASGDYFGAFTSAAHAIIRLPSYAIVTASMVGNAAVSLILQALSLPYANLRGLLAAAAVGFLVEKIRERRIRQAEEFEKAAEDLKASMLPKGK
ncbi:MAG: hypothetical protein N3F07_03920 [Candidatus Micrarchaeota archaeon]|nr:hypothetical protein [Candidatus Micrarchaeota archaeon]